MTNEEFIESIRLQGEDWKCIPNYEEFYCASTFGRILSLGRYVKVKSGTEKWNEPHILSTKYVGKSGYLSVNLSKYNKQKMFSVHRLIAITFIPNPDSKPCIDHIDTDKTNNHVNNLRWCTMSENMRNDITANRLQTFYKNDKRQKYTRQIVALKYGKAIKIYPSLKSVEQDGHSVDNVFQVCKGMRKHHHKYEWMYLSDYEKLLSNQ